MKKIFSLAFFTGMLQSLPLIVSAQGTTATAGTATNSGLPTIFFEPTFYVLAALFLLMFITIIVMVRVLMKLIRSQLPAQLVTAKFGDAKILSEELSLWSRFDRKFLTKAIPIDKEKDILFDHGYDGIHELDNDLPPWWKYGFYITIFWALSYLVYFHVTDSGNLSLQEYQAEMDQAAAAIKARMAKNSNMVTAETVVALNDTEAISAGKGVYAQYCVACHGQLGEGGVGPNLTDEYWIHGGGIKNVFTTVTKGVPSKGMISWKSQLSPKQIQQVSSFIITLKDTEPVNGKGPQGDVWKEETVSASDSSVVPAADSLSKVITLK